MTKRIKQYKMTIFDEILADFQAPEIPKKNAKHFLGLALSKM